MVLMIPHQDIFALSYKNEITLSQNPSTPNSQSNINRAKLLEVHIVNFINNISDTSKKYGLSEEKTIIDSLRITSVMLSSIQKIQSPQLEKSTANDVMTTIVEDLRVINKTIKQYFHQQVESTNNYHDKYSSAANRIANQLDNLTGKLQIKIKSKSELSSRDKEVLRYVFKLEKLSKNLKNFQNIEFYKQDEVRASLIRIVKEIKKEIQKLRDL